MFRNAGKALAGLTLVLLLSASAGAENREITIRGVSDVLGMAYPLDVTVNLPRQGGGGVTGGFMWDANAKMLKWAYDGQLIASRRYLYLGAICPTFPQAQRLPIGSEKEQALCDALRLFCDDLWPSATFDSLNAALSSSTNEDVARVLASMTETQRDALRLWPVVREVAAQRERITSGIRRGKGGEAKTQGAQSGLERRFRLEPSNENEDSFKIGGHWTAEAGLKIGIVFNGDSFAGLGMFAKGTKLIIEEDGTLSVNLEGLVVSDEAGMTWVSREVNLNGKEVIVFLPDGKSEK